MTTNDSKVTMQASDKNTQTPDVKPAEAVAKKEVVTKAAEAPKKE